MFIWDTPLDIWGVMFMALRLFTVRVIIINPGMEVCIILILLHMVTECLIIHIWVGAWALHSLQVSSQPVLFMEVIMEDTGDRPCIILPIIIIPPMGDVTRLTEDILEMAWATDLVTVLAAGTGQVHYQAMPIIFMVHVQVYQQGMFQLPAAGTRLQRNLQEEVPAGQTDQ